MEHYSFLAGSSTSLLVDFCSCTLFLCVARLHIAVNLLPQPGTGHAIFAPPCRARLMCGEISWHQLYVRNHIVHVKSDPHAHLCCSKRAGRKKPFPQSVHLKGRIFMWTAFLWTVKLPLLLNTFPHPASPQVTCSSWSFTNHLCNIWLGLDQLAQKLKICCCLTCACSLRAPVEWKLGRKLRHRKLLGTETFSASGASSRHVCSGYLGSGRFVYTQGTHGEVCHW